MPDLNTAATRVSDRGDGSVCSGVGKRPSASGNDGEERILAVIPARGGSKRVPRKNVRVLGNVPLLVWTFRAALAVPRFCDVLLTTDDEEVASIGRDYGALVPWLRPPELSSDTASSEDVLGHALGEYERVNGAVDVVVLLQPTSPFRRTNSIDKALDLFLSQPLNRPRKTVVSVSPAAAPPEWYFRFDESEPEILRPMFGWDHFVKRSQELKKSFHLNGSIYIASKKSVLSRSPLVGPGLMGFIMDGPEEAIDIDDSFDWQLAEMFLGMSEP